MISSFPPELQALIIAHLSPYDVFCLLNAFDGGELDQLFHVVTDHREKPLFFPSRLPHYTTNEFSPTDSKAVFNLIEIKDLEDLDLRMFYSNFLDETNFIVVLDFEEKKLGRYIRDEYGSLVRTANWILRFINEMTMKDSQILFFDSRSITVQLQDVPNSSKVAFRNAKELVLKARDGIQVIPMVGIEKLSFWLADQSQSSLGMLDFSREPRYALETQCNGTYAIRDMTIAAREATHTDVCCIQNVQYQSQVLYIGPRNTQPGELPVFKSISAPNLTELTVHFSYTCECDLEDIKVPSLKTLRYEFRPRNDSMDPADPQVCERFVTQLPLSNLEDISFRSSNSHTLFTSSTFGKFLKLKNLSFYFNDEHRSLLNGGYGEFPNLQELEVHSMLTRSDTTLVPDLRAPLLETFKFYWGSNERGAPAGVAFTGVEEFEKVVRLYPNLSVLEFNMRKTELGGLRKFSGVLKEISNRIECLSVSGVLLEVFANLGVTFPKLRDLKLRSFCFEDFFTFSFDAPNLSQLDISVHDSEVKGLCISHFPSLESLIFSDHASSRHYHSMEICLPNLRELITDTSRCFISLAPSMPSSNLKLTITLPHGSTKEEALSEYKFRNDHERIQIETRPERDYGTVFGYSDPIEFEYDPANDYDWCCDSCMN